VRCTFRYFSLRFVSRKPITASVWNLFEVT
jgi:hypothetical protein